MQTISLKINRWGFYATENRFRSKKKMILDRLAHHRELRRLKRRWSGNISVNKTGWTVTCFTLDTVLEHKCINTYAIDAQDGWWINRNLLRLREISSWIHWDLAEEIRHDERKQFWMELGSFHNLSQLRRCRRLLSAKRVLSFYQMLWQASEAS